MNEIMVPANAIAHCTKIILATKSHSIHPDNDINIFLDADLAILGSDENIYAAYAASIRKEYGMFDDAAYRDGRRHVLDYFLNRPRIFITDYFYRNFEQQARINLQHEAEQL